MRCSFTGSRAEQTWMSSLRWMSSRYRCWFSERAARFTSIMR
jgi:hypothetical protein